VSFGGGGEGIHVFLFVKCINLGPTSDSARQFRNSNKIT
jgi:hypothetical protein